MIIFPFKISNILRGLLITIFLMQLVACSTSHNRYAMGKDGAPKFDIDVSKIPDAVPRNEPYNKYASRSYTIRGHRYVVLKTAKGYSKYGMASWYGMKFHGYRGSIGEKYDVRSMTAASTELPLPSYVQATNMENGKTVVVRVNDRGPFECHRIMDFSFAAAKKLGFAGKGTTRVHIVGIDPDTWNNKYTRNNSIRTAANRQFAQTNSLPHDVPAFYLQAGAFGNLNSAREYAQSLASLTNNTTHVMHSFKNGSPLYRVQIGPITNQSEGVRVQNVLANHGVGHAIMIKG